MKKNLRTYVLVSITLIIVSGLVLPPQAVISQKSQSRKDASTKLVPKQGKPIAPTPSFSKRLGTSSGNRSNTSNKSTDLFSQVFLPGRNNKSALHESVLNPTSSQVQTGEIRTSGIQAAVTPAEFKGDVRSLPQVASHHKERPELEMPLPAKKSPTEANAPAAVPDNVPLAPMPVAIQNFDGLTHDSVVTGGQAGAGYPPDINGDVGTSHYIQAVNDAYAIYSKTTGAQLAAFTENSLFSGGPTGTLCDTDSFGDPVVVFDQFADRWILTNFAFKLAGNNTLPPTYQCFAVSKTSNPVSGGWWLYAVQIDTGGAQPPAAALADYPKFGNWNDGCLYMGGNVFDSTGTNYLGPLYASFNKNAMESGQALTASNSSITFVTDTSVFTPIPSNLSGAKGTAFLPTQPGTPNYFVSESQSAFAYEVRKFTPGATCGAGGTIGAMTSVSQAAYNLPQSATSTNRVQQPGTMTRLDTLGDRILQKVQYRRVGSAESVWVVHDICSVGNTGAVCGANQIGMQWGQLNVTGGTVATTPVQEQNYAPDNTLSRWMGSLAVDHLGNMALGYSTSNNTSPNFPSIRYAGRLVTDPANTLPQTETLLVAGTGSQTGISRWGDYTSMSVDPIDDCTFWYTNEYINTGAPANWRTRVGSFKFPTCTGFPTAANANVAGQILDSHGAPLGGVSITLSGPTKSFHAVTDSAGSYSFTGLMAGEFYSISPALANYTFSPGNRSFSLGANVADASFTATADAVASRNAIDSADFFVRQHYLDFLSREPDTEGLAYWSSQIAQCATDESCISNRRIDVSAAYFMETEFQQSGSFVYGLYKASYGRNPKFTEFMPDRSMVVGGANLEQSKAALAENWVTRTEFKAEYPDAMTNAEFVNKLYDTAGLAGYQTERQSQINSLNSGATRAQVLRGMIETPGFKAKEYNSAFVLMEYFGYLRRDPDEGGYNFWVNVLNTREPNNYRGMVCSFITSAEYQKRFSTIVSHTNQECGQ